MADAQAAVALLQQAFPDAVVGTGEVHGTLLVRVQADQAPLVAHYLHTKPDLRGSLSLLWAVDHRPREARSELLYLFTLEERRDWIVLATELLGSSRQFRSITPAIHAAKWYEREIRDMFGLIPVGHPDMRRLVRHEHWPKGTHPLKKDFRWDTVLARAQGQYGFRHIEGEGVFEVPVGPIHAGIIESGHFRFSVAGEPIMQLEVRHFWKHRGGREALRTDDPDGRRLAGGTGVGRHDRRPQSRVLSGGRNAAGDRGAAPSPLSPQSLPRVGAPAQSSGRRRRDL